MPVKLLVNVEEFPIAGRFVISRGAKTVARVVVCTISDGAFVGRGECVPYARYGETVESVMAAIEAMRDPIAAGAADRASIARAMPAGAARNAVDCALWDLEAKRAGRAASRSVCGRPPVAVETAVTISMDEPQAMAAAARVHCERTLIKMKVGGEGDIARMRAVAAAAPRSRLIVDANEGWTEENIVGNMLAAAGLRIALIEQPLPAGADEILARIPHPVPVCADESAHLADGLPALAGRYDFVNIKLDKTGGLTEALAMRDRARALGFGIMVGCMVGTSLSMAPAVLLAQDADYADLDGPLLLARDRTGGLTYAGSKVLPPESALWG